ncbi:MAG: hypothetical protein JWM88_2195 [Verrucomicrobia bacterium]|nr:hypothetical protein [Verrucomicrobiota bacterium]
MKNRPGHLLLLWASVGAAAGSDLTDGWAAIRAYRVDAAMEHFEAAARSGAPAVAREATLGRGVALLARQPVTAGQVDEARRILTGLVDSGADDPAQAARFYLARIAQHHQEHPDLAEAARLYRQLIAEHEESVWAQSALGRLALIQLYATGDSASPAQRLAETEKLLAHAHVAQARGELHIVLAEAIFFYRLPAQQALPHLLAAEPLGGFDRVGRADALLQIAELSRLAGEKTQAAKYYRTFLQENPRDTANYTARRHLAEVEGGPMMPPP